MRYYDYSSEKMYIDNDNNNKNACADVGSYAYKYWSSLGRKWT